MRKKRLQCAAAVQVLVSAWVPAVGTQLPFVDYWYYPCGLHSRVAHVTMAAAAPAEPTTAGTGSTKSHGRAARAEKRRTAALICGIQWGHMLQYTLISAAQSELLAKIAGHDFQLQARLTGAMFTLNFTGGFLLSPIVSGLADARGRKLFLFLPTTADLLQRIVIVPFMTVSGLVASNMLGMLSVAGMNMTR